MGATQDAHNFSLEQIQALLFDKQRQLTEDKLVRVAQAQETDWLSTPSDPQADRQTSQPARSPESWRGADGQDRFFRPTAIAPLDASPAPMPDQTRPVLQPMSATATTARRYTWRDRLLLVGEILALAAFLTILGASFRRMRDLNIEYQQAQRARVVEQNGAPLPTQAPLVAASTETPVRSAATPQATATWPATSTAAASAPVIQPGISTAATATERAATTDATATELPATTDATATPSATPSVTPEPTTTAHATATLTITPIALPGIRPAQSETPAHIRLPTTTPTIAVATEPGVPLSIQIPAIEVDAPVVQGDTWEPLKLGVGHRLGSANPGEVGNVVMSAHNDIYGEIFRQLHKVEPGDVVLIQTATDVFRYEVTSVEIVSPSRVDLMDPTDTPILTLITCYPYLLDTHRVVVRAKLVI